LILIFDVASQENLLIADGDISNLAGRMPLGESHDPNDPRSSGETSATARRWAPFWAMVFVFGAGLLSWGAIAVLIGTIAG